MDNEQYFELDLKDIFRAIKKRFYIIIVLTFIALLLAGVYSYVIAKPIYEAKTSIIIGNNPNGEQAQLQYNDLMLYQKLVKTYSSIAKTTNVAEKTIDELGLDISPEALLSRITTVPQSDTQILDIKVKAGSPEEAVDIINALSKVFIEEAKVLYPSGNVKIMDKIKMPKSPISPNKKMNIAIAFFIGIALSLMIIILLEFLDNTIKTEEDVERYLELPVVGVIPKEKEKIDRISARTLMRFHHSLMEPYRTLRTNIDFTAVYKNVKSIVVTSSIPGEGKSTTASMLASVMAQAGKKTLLIDCDLRKSKLHRMFSYNNMSGLSNILVGESQFSDVVTKSEIENLYVLTSGIKPPNPSEILSSARMKEFINKVKEEFDYVILDTPPVGLVTDAQLLSQVTDGCLLVVSSGEAVREGVVKAKGLLDHVEARILGVSLNKVKELGAYYYGQYYGYGVEDRSGKKKRGLFKNKKRRRIEHEGEVGV